MNSSRTDKGAFRKLRAQFGVLVLLGATSSLFVTGLTLSSGGAASAATPASPCNEVVSTAPGTVVATPSGSLVVGVKAGTSVLTIDCNLSSTAAYALQASLLGGISSTGVTPSNEADVATLATFAKSTTNTGCPAATAGLCTVATLAVPKTFAATDANAACPPTQAQINAGLFGCAIAVVNGSLAPLPGGEFLMTYAGQPLPNSPTITATPLKGGAGTVVTLADTNAANKYWWGNAIEAVQAAALSTTPVATPTSCTTGSGYGNVPTAFLAVKWFSSPTVTPINGGAAGVTISNDCYDGTTLFAPKLSGTTTVPAGLTAGTTYTVYVCELNATPYPSNDSSAATHCGTAPAGSTWIDASFPFTTSAGSITQSAPTSGAVTVTGSATFTAQLTSTGATGAVTYAVHAKGPSLTVSPLGVVSTSHTLSAGTYTISGTTSDAGGDVGVFTYTLTVGLITQTAPLSGTVVNTSSASFKAQLLVSGANGAVTFTKNGGSSNLSVSATGVVQTVGMQSPGSYTATGTTGDATGDLGTFTYTLAVTKSPVLILRAYRVVGRAVEGRTVTLLIQGQGFYGRPKVTSHVGTVSTVLRDSGRQLTVRTSVRAGSRNVMFTFLIVLANGKSCRVRYSQIA